MDTWSNTCRKCDWCGVRYAPRMQNTRHKGKDFCSFKCKEDWIDADNAVNGAHAESKSACDKESDLRI